MNTKFSVLISLYKTNNAMHFQQALASVFEQTYPPTEVILVIDGENTEEQQHVINKFKGKFPDILKVIPLEKNIGQGPALNEGLRHCSYELVARMDTDDISKPYRFEKQIALFEQNSEIDVASSWVDEFESMPENVVSIRMLPETHRELEKYAKSRCPFNHPVVMYKKSKVLKCGGYILLGFLDDYLLWMKMLQNKCIFYNIQESLLFYRADRMYEKRGGLQYALNACKLHWIFYRQGMINLPVFLKNVFIWFFIKMLPYNISRSFYEIFLRVKPEKL